MLAGAHCVKPSVHGNTNARQGEGSGQQQDPENTS